MLDGGSGSDILRGGAGDDVLRAYDWGSRYDRQTGRYVGNTYEGGAGDDNIRGSCYDDTYLFDLGDGQDTVTELRGTDVLVLQDIQHDQLWFERVGNDLRISVAGTADSVTVDGWYGGSSRQIETIRTADGMALDNTAVDQLVSAMAGFAKPSVSSLGQPVSVETELAPTLAAAWHPA